MKTLSVAYYDRSYLPRWDVCKVCGGHRWHERGCSEVGWDRDYKRRTGEYVELYRNEDDTNAWCFVISDIRTDSIGDKHYEFAPANMGRYMHAVRTRLARGSSVYATSDGLYVLSVWNIPTAIFDTEHTVEHSALDRNDYEVYDSARFALYYNNDLRRGVVYRTQDPETFVYFTRHRGGRFISRKEALQKLHERIMRGELHFSEYALQMIMNDERLKAACESASAHVTGSQV